MEKKIYFAYGSNMNIEQMARRCPTAKVVGTGKLMGYELLFRGVCDSAVATVEKKPHSFVLIVIWEIQPKDEIALDRYEGFPYLYRKETIKARQGNKWLTGMVYIMNDGRKFGIPSRSYYQTILDGYKANGLDTSVLETALQAAAGKVR